jgi:EmrB/QacA subfamily drug resistance transporter
VAPAETTSIGPDGQATQTSASIEAVVTGRTWLATAVLLVAAFMELMDVTMANVAVPSIRSELGASYGQVLWVVAGYALTFAVFLLTGGRLGDIYGRKRMFLTGLIGFLAASALCGVAPNPDFLVGARVLQGFAAAIMLPQVLACINVWFPEEKRAAAFGLFGAVTGLGGIAAPLIAGVLINANIFNWDWRPIFLINVPIGIVVFIVGLSVMTESKSPAQLKLDPVGVLVSAGAVFLLIYPIIQGQENDWAPWIWIMLALSLPLIALFVAVERWKMRRDGSPVIDLGMFKIQAFSVGLLINLVFFAGVTAIAFVMMVFLQSGLHYGALKAGATVVPLALGLVFGSGLSINLSKKLGRTVLQIGSMVALGAALWTGWTIGDKGESLGAWNIVWPLAVLGIGLGIVIAPLSDFILAKVPPENTGSGSGLQATTVQMGSAVGVAALGAALVQFLAEGKSFSTSTQQVLYIDAAVFAFTTLLVFFYGGRTTGNDAS